MSNIVIVLQKSTAEVPVLGALHKILGRSLAEIRTSIREHSPIVEIELFQQQEETASLLRKIIELVRQYNLAVDVYELPECDKYDSSAVVEQSRISMDVLRGILDSNDEELERQLNSEL